MPKCLPRSLESLISSLSTVDPPEGWEGSANIFSSNKHFFTALSVALCVCLSLLCLSVCGAFGAVSLSLLFPITPTVAAGVEY